MITHAIAFVAGAAFTVIAAAICAWFYTVADSAKERRVDAEEAGW